MLLETERRGQHVVLTLNRPEKLNALSYELIDALMDRLDALERDDTVRCLVLTGRGRHGLAACRHARPQCFHRRRPGHRSRAVHDRRGLA